MKLNYSKILLIAFPLNILVTSYQAHNTNKPYITPHHTETNRSLCECDTQSSNYDKDTGMKNVMQQFEDRTSQRFEEYKERLKDKRQKRKEEREKNIQKIIEEDKREKSLSERVEKGCLRCGCGLGGVAASVGVFGGLGVYGSEMAATAVAAKAAGIKKGIEVGLFQVIEEVKQLLPGWEGKIPEMKVLETLTEGISGDNLTLYDMFKCINSNIKGQGGAGIHSDFSYAVNTIAGYTPERFNAMTQVSANAVASAFEKGKGDAIIATHAEYAHLYSAIGYSVLAILIIVLVMIIIYLVLRYRRKKKMNKKAEYTKLLNQ
ncbi:rifin PIR protein, putative [Plasmodium sp. DRC-Itaito]|nr:rifin PIR protein, putative [Plasmodium sp. DRC-Itaito]